MAAWQPNIISSGLRWYVGLEESINELMKRRVSRFHCLGQDKTSLPFFLAQVNPLFKALQSSGCVSRIVRARRPMASLASMDFAEDDNHEDGKSAGSGSDSEADVAENMCPCCEQEMGAQDQEP